MAILIDKRKRVLVQGITGREGLTRTKLMLDYGTQVVAGVTPGKGGQTVLDVPVYDTLPQAIRQQGQLDISVIFVPAPLVKAAALEALGAGVKLLVLVPDRVPLYDVLEIAAVAEAHNAQFIGPNTLGVLSADEAVLGMMGGRADSIRQWARRGPVGISSRSGGVTTSMAYYISRAGHGLSTIAHVGGDSVVGLTHADMLRLFEADPQTEIVVMYGEIGGSQEETAADLLASGAFTKPLIAYVGGKAAREGMRFSHAGAIIEGDTGTHAGKVQRLREAGAYIAESYADIPALVAQALGQRSASVSLPTSKKQPDSNTYAWHTAITDIQPNVIRLRGQPIESLMGTANVGQVVHLALMGVLPQPNVGRMVEAILVSSVDHGATPPSTLAARTSASTGAALNAALATGLLSINRHHGGAIEACMLMLKQALDHQQHAGTTIEQSAAHLVRTYRAEKRRLPGLGHRIHSDDPRSKRLLALAEAEGIAGGATRMARAIVQALAEQTERTLPLNVDGAIAAVLLDMQVDPGLGNAFFMLARLPGLIAHIREEQTRERPMRVIHPRNVGYDGP
jgi:succinyl-CoA synthetase alpha subunit